VRAARGLEPKLIWDLDDPDYQAPLVTVFGAGIAGLTVAHELAERGFHVQVVEPKESQFEEYECEVGGMAANQFSRVPAPLREVHPHLPDVPGGQLDRLRQVRRFYDLKYEFERAQPRFPIKHRLRFDKEKHRPPRVPPPGGGGLEEEHPRFQPAEDLAGSAGRGRRDHRGVRDRLSGEKVPEDWRDYWDEHDVTNHVKLQEVLHIIKDAHAFYSARYAEREQEALMVRPELRDLPLDSKDRLREILLIRIIGYTDSDGLPENNRTIGKCWAEQVKAALQQLNASQRREFQVPTLDQHLEVIGAGPAQPRGDQQDRMARARSNRVEFQIVEQLLPGEHGFRFFPNFYRHLFDTMQRTPLLGELGAEHQLTAFDQLVATPEAFLALEDDLPPFRARLRRFRTLIQIREAFDCFLGRLGFTGSDLAIFNLKFQKYMTSSPPRRQHEAEDCNFMEYFCGPRDYSAAAHRFINATPRALAAMSATETDARTQCDVLIQLMGQDPLQPFVDDMTLNGSTTVSWLLPWKRYLVRQGVRFFVGKLSGVYFDGDEFIPVVDGPRGAMVPRAEDPRYQLRGHMVDRCHQPITADRATAGGRSQFYVLALPFEEAAAIADAVRQAAAEEGIQLQGPLQQLAEYAEFCGRPAGGRTHRRRRDPTTGRPLGEDCMRDISGIQYFFPNNYRLGSGHVYWVDSPWALTSISQLAFWRDRVRPVGDYIGQVSVDLGDWYAPSSGPDPEGKRDPGHTAWHSTRWEIARTCWEQIKAGLSPDRRSVINPPRYYHLDLGIEFSEEKHVGSHGNLILKILPIALRRPEPDESYRLVLICSTPSEEPGERDDTKERLIEIELATTPDGPNGADTTSVAAELASEINLVDRGHFAFAVHDRDFHPAEILISPKVVGEQVVFYFRLLGHVLQSSCHIFLNDVTIRIDPENQSLAYYVEKLHEQLKQHKQDYIDIVFVGANHVVVRSTNPKRPIVCAVANRDDMIEVVDGPRLEAKSRFPNIQVVGRPGRTSGVARAAAFRANALVEAEVVPAKPVAGSDEVVYPEPGRSYRLSVVVDNEGGAQLLAAEHRAAPCDTPAALFDSLWRQIREAKPANLIHAERIEIGEGDEARPAILISPYARAEEILIQVTGSSAEPFTIEVDGHTMELLDDGDTPADEIRNRILARLTSELADSPHHADIAVAAVGERSLCLSRKPEEDSAPRRPILATVWNQDNKIELVGAPVVEVRTKDLRIDMATRDPVPLYNNTPFQINPPRHWRRRPGHASSERAGRRPWPSFPGEDGFQDADVFDYGHAECPVLRGWIVTGTHMATHTRLTTMEAANESGRHAVNAILNQLLEDDAGRLARRGRRRRRLFGDYCRTWDVENEEFEDLKFLKELDAALFAEGLPHAHDILRLQDGLGLAQDLGLTGPSPQAAVSDDAILAALSGLLGPFFLTKTALHQLELMGDLLRRKAKRGKRR
jgi:hypothetical protein